MNSVLDQAANILRAGGVIAYPTEAVYGLGCDPLNEGAFERLLTLKHRSPKQGVVLIAAEFEHIAHFIGPTPIDAINRARASWPGPYTWVFPRAASVPDWIVGTHTTIALRVTAHPVASALCQSFGSALVSTSANRHGHPPARSASEVRAYFGESLDFVVEGALGELAQPTPIRDAISEMILR